MCAALSVGLSGCVGGGGGPSRGAASGIPAEAPPPDYDESTGALQGKVVDAETLPIAGASLQLNPTGLMQTSAQDGGFGFNRLTPGRYALFVGALGYGAEALSVEILPGVLTTRVLRLEEIPVAEPRLEVYGPFQGYMQCRMSTPSSSGACGFPVLTHQQAQMIWFNDKVLWDFGKLSGNDWQQLVFEAAWRPSSAATNPNMMQVFSYSNRTSSHWFADSGGKASPIVMIFTRGEDGPGGQLPSGQPREPNRNLTLRTWITLPFAQLTKPVELVHELRFQMMVSVFYSQNAPETYTALPDS